MEKPPKNTQGKTPVPNLSTDAQSPDAQSPDGSDGSGKQPPTALRCFTGAIAASTFSLLAYRLTLAVATSFANKPVTSSNPAVVNISAAVRTLVIGIVALGAGVFGVAALGLAALGIQLLFKPNSPTKAGQKVQQKNTALEETQNIK